VLTEAPFVPVALQNEMNEVLFEDFRFDSCLRRPAAWFSAYEFTEAQIDALLAAEAAAAALAVGGVAMGSSSSSASTSADGVPVGSGCTVIDSGFSCTHVLPFVNGKCLKRGVKRVNVGGKLLTNYLKEVVSYRQWNMMDEFKLMDAVKETLCYTSLDFHADLAAVHLSNQKPKGGRAPRLAPFADYQGGLLRKGYILPDFQSVMRGYVRADSQVADPNHQELVMETERFSVAEVLFNPSDVGMEQAGVAEATAEALAALDPVDAGLAAANLVLTGGNCNVRCVL